MRFAVNAALTLAAIMPFSPADGLLLPLNIPSISSFINTSSATKAYDNITTKPLLIGWPDVPHTFHIEKDLSINVFRLGRRADMSLESEVQENLELIGLDIDTEGPSSGQIDQMSYSFDWVSVVFLPLELKTPRPHVDRELASKLVDYTSGLVSDDGLDLFYFIFGSHERRIPGARGTQDSSS